MTALQAGVPSLPELPANAGFALVQGFGGTEDRLLSTTYDPNSAAYSANQMRAYATAARSDSEASYQSLWALAERLKQEAQIHAGEARCANATIAEIYQLCAGATGEPGNWNGAEPVRAFIAAKEAEVGRLRAELGKYANTFNWDADARGIRRVWLEPDSTSPTAYNGFESARAALTQGETK